MGWTIKVIHKTIPVVECAGAQSNRWVLLSNYTIHDFKWTWNIRNNLSLFKIAIIIKLDAAGLRSDSLTCSLFWFWALNLDGDTPSGVSYRDEWLTDRTGRWLSNSRRRRGRLTQACGGGQVHSRRRWKAKDDECLHIEANKEELGRRSLINGGQGGRSVFSNHCDEQLNWVRGVCITRWQQEILMKFNNTTNNYCTNPCTVSLRRIQPP